MRRLVNYSEVSVLKLCCYFIGFTSHVTSFHRFGLRICITCSCGKLLVMLQITKRICFCLRLAFLTDGC